MIKFVAIAGALYLLIGLVHCAATVTTERRMRAWMGLDDEAIGAFEYAATVLLWPLFAFFEDRFDRKRDR